MKIRILVVAKDAGLRGTVARPLLQAGYGVELAETARHAREVLAHDTIALTILALQDLGAAGCELANDINARKGRLVILDPADDDAPTNPASATSPRLPLPVNDRELLVQVKLGLSVTQTRGPAWEPACPPLLKFEGYTLDLAARLCVDAQGRELALTRAEFTLLAALAQQPRRVLSRDELTFAVAGREAEPDDRSVDVLISRLRRKIETIPKTPRLILTVPGEGYRFAVTPEQVARPAPAAMPVAATPDSAATAAGPAAKTRVPGDERRGRLLPIGASILALLILATVGWTAWKYRAISRQMDAVAQALSSSGAAQPGPLQAQQRDAVFKRMTMALQDDRYSWRTVERLAIEAGVDEASAHAILAEHQTEIVLGKSHEGKLIARLSAR